MSESDAIVIGSAVFDRSRAELRGRAGERLSLRPQSLRVLEALVARRGKVLDREALMRAVWPDTVVTDDSLVQCIGEIRRAIGDADHRLLRTVARRGYCLEPEPVGDAKPAAVPIPPSGAGRAARAPRRLVVSASGALLVVAAAVAIGLQGRTGPAPQAPMSGVGDRPPLAVLAFRDLDGDAAATSLGAGLAEDLTADLARDVDLHVVSTRSSFALAGSALSATEIAARLGVRFLVDGTVRRESADALSLRVQLIDGSDGRIVWADSSRFGAQSLAAERELLLTRIAGSVEASMRRHQKHVVLARAPASLDVYTLTLRGFANKHRYTAAAYRAARADFERAIGLDARHAPAWAGLGYLNTIDAINGITGAWSLARLPEALTQIERALALDPALSIVHQGRAIALGALQRFTAAREAAEEAVRLAPRDPDNQIVLAMAQAEGGHDTTALQTMAAALPLYPIEPAYVSFIDAHVLWAGGLNERALVKASACIERAPQFLNCRVTRASALVDLGRLDEARLEAARIRELAPAAGPILFTNRFAGVPALAARRLAAARQLGFAER